MRKKKASSKKRQVYIILISIVIGIILLYKGFDLFFNLQEKKQARLTRYSALGIDIPPGFLIHGIDVSSHQGYIYWPGVKRMQVADIRIGFVCMKATEGVKDEDRQFKRNWAAARQLHMICGAYHYFITTKSGQVQAHNFIKNVSLQKGDLPPILDVEELYGVSPAMMRKRVKECLQTMEVFYKVKPMIYTNIAFYENYLGKDFDDYPLWIANYLEPEKPHIERNWLFWQHSDKGHVDGIRTTVDFNVFKGDTLSFKKILLQ